jgi:glucokinase
MMSKQFVGVDLGGTQIRAACVSLEGVLSARTARKTPASEGPDAVVRKLIAAIEETIDNVEGEVDAIGIGAPGPVDPATGIIYDPPNLPGWGTRSIGEPLEHHFDIPVYVGNDANVAALGEQQFGAGGKVQELLYITVSTGIGGGIVSKGKLFTGWRGLAAEIGHQTLVIDGPMCGCGQPGHLEALASGPAIARQVREKLQDGLKSTVLDNVDSPDEITAAEVAKAAGEGDEVAKEAFRQAGMFIGIGITNLIHILEPELIIIGGGVSKAGPLLFEPIRATVEERVMSDIFKDVSIRGAQLEEDVGLYGAAALALVSVSQ